MENKNNQVRFIRKNGRVIPIKNKKKMSSSDKVFIGGLATSAVSGAGLGASLATEKDIDINDFKKKYAKDVAKTGVSFEKVKRQGFFAQYQSYGIDQDLIIKKNAKLLGEIKRGERKGFFSAVKQGYINAKESIVKMNKISYNDLTQKESVLLHELGHAKSMNRKYSMNRFHMGSIKHSQKKNLLRPWTNLISEAEATGEAIGMAYKAGGKKHAAKIGLRLLPAYGTYVGGAAMATAFAMQIHDVIKKKKNGK